MKNSELFNKYLYGVEKDKRVPIYRGCPNGQCFCTGACKEIIGYQDEIEGYVKSKLQKVQAGLNNQTFKLNLGESFAKKNDVLQSSNGDQIKVISTPTKNDKWWQRMLRFISFGFLYQLRYEYTVKVV